MREIQRHSSFQVLQFARERQRQSRKPSDLHSHGQVLALNKTGRDVARVRISASDFGYNLRDSWWGVPRIRPVMLPVVPKELCQLREIGSPAKRTLDRFLVEDVRVGRQLDSVADYAAAEITHERLSVRAAALADNKRRHQLCVRVECNKNPLISELHRVILANILGFLRQECPYLIALNATAGQVAHSLIKKLFAMFPGLDKQSHYRVAIHARSG